MEGLVRRTVCAVPTPKRIDHRQHAHARITRADRQARPVRAASSATTGSELRGLRPQPLPYPKTGARQLRQPPVLWWFGHQSSARSSIFARGDHWKHPLVRYCLPVQAGTSPQHTGYTKSPTTVRTITDGTPCTHACRVLGTNAMRGGARPIPAVRVRSHFAWGSGGVRRHVRGNCAWTHPLGAFALSPPRWCVAESIDPSAAHRRTLTGAELWRAAYSGLSFSSGKSAVMLCGAVIPRRHTCGNGHGA